LSHRTLTWAAVSCALLLSACVSEPREPVDLGETGGDPRALPGSIHGVVRTPGGSFVPGVSVGFGDREATTDSRGFFQIPGVDPGPGVIKASREGWSSTQRAVDVPSDAVTQVELHLLFMSHGSIEVAEPGPAAVVDEGGVRVEFVKGTFTDDDGVAVQGPIDVAIALINDSDAMHAAPGDMLAADGGDPFPLESYGMVEVVLTAGGAPVTFSGSALLSYPLVADHGFADGDPIPLWSFDEPSNLWLAEGEGVVDNDRFVAEVSHFTWWNADKPLLETTCVSGVLSMPNGSPAIGFTVNGTGLDHLGASSTITGLDGSFCLPLKRGGIAELSAAGSDGSAIWSWTELYEASASPGECGASACDELGTVSLADLTTDDDGDGVTELAGDCDDSNAAVSPLVPDVLVDGLDDDCDGVDGPDVDGDGAPDMGAGGTDCDDADPAVGPSRPELCNGHDDNCDGTIDGLSPLDGEPVYADLDGDGSGDPLDLLLACAPPQGYVDNADDCDDLDPFVSPDAPELCAHPTLGAGIDEDCDGLIDEADATDGTTFYADLDADGVGATGNPVTACVLPAMASVLSGDCNDDAPSVFPGATEECNGLDDNCDGFADEAGAVGELTFYVDGDGDGYGVVGSVVFACAVPTGAAVLSGDCDDSDPATNPGAVESCSDTADLNCDGSVQFADLDGDGAPACADCDDNDAAVGPSAVELCDTLDSDCDGSLVDFFANQDGDQWPDCIDTDDDNDGDPDGLDCAPLDASVFLGAPELCDSIDSDCDGSLVDSFVDTDVDDEPDCVDLDDDGDSFSDAVDCQPLDPTSYPGAPELCDGIDNDCDGVADACSGSASDGVLYGVVSSAQLGASLAQGDVDGDGVPDLIVGAPGGAGAVQVHLGPNLGSIAAGDADAVLTGEAVGDESGKSVVSGCDLNGDGFDDVAVGAWGHDQGGQTAGAVYVVFGPMAGVQSLATADAVFYGESGGDWAGWSIGCAGDTDGDGIDGLLVGAWREDEGTLDAGAVYLLEGSITSGTVASLAAADAKLLGESAFDYAGYSVSGAGDVNGDGFDDVLIGAWGRDEAGSQAGATYLVNGPFSGTLSLVAAEAKLLGTSAGEQSGAMVSRAGDVDGDGFDDILIGGWAAPGDSTDFGVAHVVLGPISGLVSLANADHEYVGLFAGDRLGESGGPAGDVDGDGFDDILIGAPRRDVGQVDAGAAYLLLGSATGLPADLGGAAAILVGETGGAQAGTATTGAGDLDGDGLDDVMLGAPYADPLVVDGGAVYLLVSSSILPQ